MSYTNAAGSMWYKWDLHVHSPSSIVQNYGGNTDEVWESFIRDIEMLPPEFKVIGINDYIFVDGYERVLRAKKSGRLPNIDLILPVIELRLDKFAGVVKRNTDGSYSKSDWNRINLHIIFDQLDPELIRQQFLSSLVQCYHLIPEANHLNGKWQAVVTPESLARLGQMIIDSVPAEQKANYGDALQEGFNNLCVSLDKVLETLERHDLKERFLLAVGKTEWENMKWNDQSIAEKKNVINRVHLVFAASENPESYKNARDKLMNAKVLDKLLDCSDAHDLSSSENKDRIGQCFTWIKADPTFQGLLQAVTEFNQRVFIGDTPPKKLLVAANRTKYVSGITIKKKPGSSLPDLWFDTEIPLNHDLVAIIGNKGSGKSALADVAALVGDTRNHESFSFLNEKRFRDPRTKLASHFYGILHWHDGTNPKRDLNENPEATRVERIKYLPQSYLETLCNELGNNGSSTFDGELRKIIYTHVPEEDRLGFLSLDELLDFKVAELESERDQLREKLSKINAELVSVERRLAPAFRESLERQLETKNKELTALEGAKPAPIDDPQESESAKQETAVATAKLAELERAIAEIRSEEQAARQKKADAAKGLALVSKISQSIKNYQSNHEQFVADLDVMLLEVSQELKASSLVSLTVDTSSLDALAVVFRETVKDQDILLLADGETSLLRRRELAEAEIAKIKGQLGEKQRLFLVYKEKLSKWEQAKAELQGTKDKNNTIAWYEAELEALNLLPEKREELRTKRRDIVRRLHEQLGKLIDEYRKLYEPVQGFVQSAERMDMPLPLAFSVHIAEEGFHNRFLSQINRQKRGTFAGIDGSNLLLRTILQETDFSSIDHVLEFVERIDEMLHFDKRGGASNPIEQFVPDQLREGHNPEGLYDFLFGLSYLSPRYSLTYDGQEISQLSPGERGLLLLVFYLLVDKDDIPLVIDQPEENLDNQTIYKVLVTCIKRAKERRQVIMVTHNPNLAVVCDAEQIIYAACDKAKKRFTYTCGAIESPDIKSRVVEILEGTEPAFVNRKRKYGF
jgi:hypothetical protein